MSNIQLHADGSCQAALAAISKQKRDFVFYSISQKPESIIVAALHPAEEGKTNPDPEAYAAEVHPQFLKALEGLGNDPVFVALDFRYKNNEGNPASKIVGIKYCPDKAAIKVKFSFGSTWVSWKQAMGIAVTLEVSTLAEVSFDNVRERCLKL